jgi:thiamine biosynthesis protein ThiS
MQVTLNGELHDLPAGSTIDRLLRELGRDPQQDPVAVAVNLSVVPRDEHGQRELRDGDRVDIVGAVGGG